MRRGRGTRRSLAGPVAGAALGVAALVTAAVWTLAVVTARRVVTPPAHPTRGTAIAGIAPGAILLPATAETRLPGRYGLWFDDDRGHAKLGEVLGEADGLVRRELIALDFGRPEVGMTGRMGSAYYLSPRELGVPVEDVEISTELGPAPAWLVPAGEDGRTGERWAILVHGRNAQRHETIRAIPPLREAGWTTLSVSYRNDPGAPPSPDGRYALGDREWADVEAAIRWALDRGAQRIVLVGWSMGGALCLQAITRSPLARSVESLVLDSPVVDWVTALRFQTRLNRLPSIVLPPVLRLLGSPWGARMTGQAEPIDLRRLDLVRGAAALRVPILIMHSADDGYVPIDASRALAEARPDLVHLEEFSLARHVRLWNLDPERWTRTIRSWLSGLDAARDRVATGSTARRPRRP